MTTQLRALKAFVSRLPRRRQASMLRRREGDGTEAPRAGGSACLCQTAR